MNSQSQSSPSITSKTMPLQKGGSTGGASPLATLAQRIGNRAVYVLLDFDGVLHSDSAGPRSNELATGSLNLDALRIRLDASNSAWDRDDDPFDPRPGQVFDRIGPLCDLLKEFKTAQIVVATSWRSKLDLAEFKRVLPPKLASRVVAVLPACSESLPGTREALFRQLLSSWGQSSALWIALDDQARHYSAGCSHLVQTSASGLESEAIMRVRNCLFDQV
jgi:hypothetical protein